jgi:hypothetical protein
MLAYTSVLKDAKTMKAGSAARLLEPLARRVISTRMILRDRP